MIYFLLAGRPRRSKCFAFSGINAGLFLRRIGVVKLGPTLTKKFFVSVLLKVMVNPSSVVSMNS